MEACRAVRGTDVQTATKDSARQTLGQSLVKEAVGKVLGSDRCKWGLGSSRESKVERGREGEREREREMKSKVRSDISGYNQQGN